MISNKKAYISVGMALLMIVTAIVLFVLAFTAPESAIAATRATVDGYMSVSSITWIFVGSVLGGLFLIGGVTILAVSYKNGWIGNSKTHSLSEFSDQEDSEEI